MILTAGGLQAGDHSISYFSAGEPFHTEATGNTEAPYLMRSGFSGRIVALRSLAVALADGPGGPNIREKSARQVVVTVTLDDDSLVYPLANELAWRSFSNGLLFATGTTLQAGAVSIDTRAGVACDYRGASKIFIVQILDVVERYTDWQTNYFTAEQIANDPLTSATESYAGDGLPNLIKYALGLNPRTAGAGGPWTVAINGNHLALSFQRKARPDLLFQVEASDDLHTWNPIWQAEGGTGPEGMVTVNDPVGISGATPRRFLRLAITASSAE